MNEYMSMLDSIHHVITEHIKEHGDKPEAIELSPTGWYKFLQEARHEQIALRQISSTQETIYHGVTIRRVSNTRELKEVRDVYIERDVFRGQHIVNYRCTDGTKGHVHVDDSELVSTKGRLLYWFINNICPSHGLIVPQGSIAYERFKNV